MAADAYFVVLSFDDLTSVIVALQERIRNESGLVTEQGLVEYRALHDRLDAVWRATDEPIPEAVNDARRLA